jgi:hypothetical protein
VVNSGLRFAIYLTENNRLRSSQPHKRQNGVTATQNQEFNTNKNASNFEDLFENQKSSEKTLQNSLRIHNQHFCIVNLLGKIINQRDLLF